MARRRRTGPADDLFELVAMLPWWGGVALALISYLVLHSVAGHQIAVTGAPGQIGAVVAASLWKSMASVGQYVLPIICLAAALGSALGRRKRRALIEGVVANSAANALDGMSWREFEMLVGEAFRLQGYRVIETGGGGSDGGVDLVLQKEDETFLVQCKQWKALKVSVTLVRELFGVMAARGAAGGFVVTSGRFTREATEFADGRNVKLIEGSALMGLIGQAQAARSGARSETLTAQHSAPSSLKGGSAQTCPNCGGGMIRRTAKRGANAGGEFWGCQTYPACRGIRPIR